MSAFCYHFQHHHISSLWQPIWMISNTPTQTKTDNRSWCIIIISIGEQYWADISSIVTHGIEKGEVVEMMIFDSTSWDISLSLFCSLSHYQTGDMYESTSRWVWLHWIHRINELYQAKQDIRIHRLIPPHSWSLVWSGYIWSYTDGCSH